jgi:hypothetical protein
MQCVQLRLTLVFGTAALNGVAVLTSKALIAAIEMRAKP